MSIPKSPRQQMVNMMYLVLTALLALNVSAEILNAFETVNDGLSQSNSAIVNRNAQIYAAFDREVANGRHGSELLQKRAQKAQKLAASFIGHIEKIKDQVAEESGGMDGSKLRRPGDLDAPSQIMLKEGGAKDLHRLLKQYRDSLLEQLDEEDKIALAQTLPLGLDETNQKSESEVESWARKMFYHMPAVSALTHLNKIQADVRNSESQIIQALFEDLGGELIEVDTFVALVNAPSSYIMEGETFESEIFLAAASKSVPMEVWVGGNELQVNGSKANYVARTQGVGKKSFGGKIRFFNSKSGKWNELPFKQEYTVAKASASMSPSSMNLFYIGVENPIDVAVAGMDDSKVKFTVQGDVGSSISKQGQGKYMVKVSKPGKARAITTVEYPSGRTESFEREFRVLPVPNPNVTYQGKAGGSIAASLFKQGTSLRASLNYFPINVNYRVRQFQLVLIRDGEVIRRENVRGGELNGAAKEMVRMAKRGDQYRFEDIAVAVPGTADHKPLLYFKIK